MPQFADIVKLVKTAYLSMSNLIPKSALLAELNRKKIPFKRDVEDGNYPTYLCAIMDFEDYINSLEVKEVDLEKETKKWWKEHLHLNPENKLWMDAHQSIVFAKHFFELGLKASNPITATDRGTAEEIIINLKRVEKDYRINLTREIEWLRNKVKKGD